MNRNHWFVHCWSRIAREGTTATNRISKQKSLGGMQSCVLINYKIQSLAIPSNYANHSQSPVVISFLVRENKRNKSQSSAINVFDFEPLMGRFSIWNLEFLMTSLRSEVESIQKISYSRRGSRQVGNNFTYMELNWLIWRRKNVHIC